jgi:hypothetical protein
MLVNEAVDEGRERVTGVVCGRGLPGVDDEGIVDPAAGA